MKIKKRILSFALAVMLIAALAVPAFAASTTNSGTYDDCIYSTYTSCEKYSYCAIIEFLNIIQPSQKTYNDYAFKSNVTVWLYTPAGTSQLLGLNYGTSATRISCNSGNYEYELSSVDAKHYVNNVEVGEDSNILSPWHG